MPNKIYIRKIEMEKRNGEIILKEGDWRWLCDIPFWNRLRIAFHFIMNH